MERERLETSFAPTMARWLVQGRERGRITPEKPVTGADIAARYNRLYDERVAGSDVRRAVSYLRVTLGMPIGSSSGYDRSGYYICLTAAEWRECSASLRRRGKKILLAASRPAAMFKHRGQLKLPFNGERRHGNE